MPRRSRDLSCPPQKTHSERLAHQPLELERARPQRQYRNRHPRERAGLGCQVWGWPLRHNKSGCSEQVGQRRRLDTPHESPEPSRGRGACRGPWRLPTGGSPRKPTRLSSVAQTRRARYQTQDSRIGQGRGWWGRGWGCRILWGGHHEGPLLPAAGKDDAGRESDGAKGRKSLQEGPAVRLTDGPVTGPMTGLSV